MRNDDFDDLLDWLTLATMVAAMFALASIFLTGCDSPGKLSGSLSQSTETVTQTDGTKKVTETSKAEMDVNQISEAITEAWMKASVENGLSAGTGAVQSQTSDMIAAGQSWILFVMGGIGMLGAAGLMVARRFLPFPVPTTAVTMLGGAGMVVVAIPLLPTWALLLMVAGIVVAGVMWSWRATIKDKLNL